MASHGSGEDPSSSAIVVTAPAAMRNLSLSASRASLQDLKPLEIGYDADHRPAMNNGRWRRPFFSFSSRLRVPARRIGVG